MSNKKYELVSKNPVTRAYQIRALRDFCDVKAGDLGGWIAGEHNLSHEGDCWIYDNAAIFNNVLVSGNAVVSGNASAYNNASITDNAEVSDHARVFDNARISGRALVSDQTRVCGNAVICDNARVLWRARVENAVVSGSAIVSENQRISFGELLVDITNNQNKEASIKVQTGLDVDSDGFVHCYKSVFSDLTSLHDSNFQYKIGEWAEEPNTDPDHTASCASGLHFSHMTYWRNRGTFLYCKVHIDDIVAVQDGKFRARKAFVIDKIVI